jgi:transcriptional regulator with XRE-family HTH domain
MFNIIFEDEYDNASRLLVELREGAGLSQRELAGLLSRSQGHVHRMETRQRPIELVEFCRIARASGVDPLDALRRLLDAWGAAGHTYGADRNEISLRS